jgi:hypothetical protein
MGISDLGIGNTENTENWNDGMLEDWNVGSGIGTRNQEPTADEASTQPATRNVQPTTDK